MELQAVLPLRLAGDGGVAMLAPRVAPARGVADLDEAALEARDRVAVAHPDRLLGSDPVEERRPGDGVQRRGPVLAPRVLDRPARVLGDLLVPEAEAEHRHAEVEHVARPAGV